MALKNLASALLVVTVIVSALAPSTVFAIPACTGMDKECGDSLSSWIVKAVGMPPTDDCCKELIKFGKECHDAYVQINVKNKSYVGTLEELLKRADETWNECVAAAAVVEPPLPSFDF